MEDVASNIWQALVLGTAGGAVIVSNCQELGGLEYRERARRVVASVPDAHLRDWAGAEERGLGERTLLGLYDGGAVTAVALSDHIIASGGRDGFVHVWRIPAGADMDDPSHPAKARPGRKCPPRHPTHFELSFLEAHGIL